MPTTKIGSNGTAGEKLSPGQLQELDRYLDRQLEKYSGSESDKPSGSTSRFSLKKILLWLTGIAVSLLLPFFVLIRTSVYLYSHYGWNGWLALSAGVAATILLLLAYALFASFKWQKKLAINRYLGRGLILLVIAYCCYGLLYLSGMNAKTDEVRSYYRSLHPILRIAMATTTLADRDRVITDIRRVPADYQQMGLPQKDHSLHFVQESGFVHAVDLRTINQPEWENWMMRHALSIMGFKTIRHVGTADHLHVSLPIEK